MPVPVPVPVPLDFETDAGACLNVAGPRVGAGACLILNLVPVPI